VGEDHASLKERKRRKDAVICEGLVASRGKRERSACDRLNTKNYEGKRGEMDRSAQRKCLRRSKEMRNPSYSREDVKL